MKRIVIDARESGTTTGRYLDKLIEYMHKQQPKYEIILLVKSHRQSFFHEIAPSYQTVITAYKEFTFGEQLGFLRQLNQLKADVVFFPMVQQPVLYRGTVVTTMQDLTTIRFRNPAKNWLVFTIKQTVYKWVNKYVAKKSRYLITPSKFVKRDVAKYCRIDPGKITVTYEAADKINAPAAPVKKVTGKQFLLSVGRPAANKNLDRLVDAFNILAADRSDLYLVLAGKMNPEYKKLQAYAQRQTYGTRVIFPGFVSEGQLRWLYEKALVYVFPSLSEGFGLPGLEAMQYSLAVTSSNATCLPEIYQDGAVYFDPHDTADMAEKIATVLDDATLATNLARNGKKVVSTYSWQRMARQTLAVFKKALE